VSVLKKEMQNCISVAIHVRRGDYVGDGELDICSMSYYRNAIEYLKKKQSDLKFYVFSNDTEFCKINFFFLNNVVFVDTSKEDKSDYWDMFLMTQVKHLIIPNSTFSWWGAFLNANPQKIVIVPERYDAYNTYNTSHELYPPEWVKLAVN
jgi:hypothetical protein